MNDTMRQILPRWITALRSGDFEQGNAYLRYHPDNTYCCLGVLCHIHPKVRYGPTFRYTYTPDDSTNAEYLPSGLADSLGVSQSGQLTAIDETGRALLRAQTTTLVKLNDDEMFDFNAIADVLQGVLDGHIGFTPIALT